MTTQTLDGPVCECGAVFTLPAHLGKHRPACLGAEPDLDALRRIGKVTDTVDGCMEWNGKRNGYGYGILPPVAARRLGERRAHRAAFAIVHGQRAELHVLHSCDNPPCIAPEHLREGTQADNSADMMQRGRGRGQRQPVEREGRTCPICETVHQRRPGDRQQTCSLSCAAKLSWRTAPKRNTRASGGEDRACTVCGTTFHVARPSIRRRTCSDGCTNQQRWITRRGTENR